MARVNHKLVRQRLNEKRSQIRHDAITTIAVCG